MLGILCWSLFCYAFCVISSFAIILKMRDSWLLGFNCLPGISCCVLWLFLAVSRIGLQCVVVVFHDHTHLLYEKKQFDITYISWDSLYVWL